jgi:hypothetical protein
LNVPLILLCACLSACSDPGTSDEPDDEIQPDELSVTLGVPSGDDGLGFAPLDEGAVLKLQTFGQGGTHVLIAVRCTGCDNRAYVSAVMRNLTSGKEVSEPAPARPQLLYCTDDGNCDLVPYLVHASGIAADEERDGLRVQLEAVVESETGLAATGSREIVLSTADL